MMRPRATASSSALACAFALLLLAVPLTGARSVLLTSGGSPADAAGPQVARPSAPSSDDRHPPFVWDGWQIIVTGPRSSGGIEIQLVNADGSTLTQVIRSGLRTTDADATGRRSLTSGLNGFPHDPTSPHDGTRITFTSVPGSGDVGHFRPNPDSARFTPEGSVFPVDADAGYAGSVVRTSPQ